MLSLACYDYFKAVDGCHLDRETLDDNTGPPKHYNGHFQVLIDLVCDLVPDCGGTLP